MNKQVCLEQYRLCMERGKFHNIAAQWFLDPIRGYPCDSTAYLPSSIHHQLHAERLYREARVARENYYNLTE